MSLRLTDIFHFAWIAAISIVYLLRHLYNICEGLLYSINVWLVTFTLLIVNANKISFLACDVTSHATNVKYLRSWRIKPFVIFLSCNYYFRNWDFPNGGPPRYQPTAVAPPLSTEYERPPPYYYPGPGWVSLLPWESIKRHN